MDAKEEPVLTKAQSRWMAIKFVLFSISAGVIEAGSYYILNEFTHIDQYTNLDEVFGNEYGLTYFIALVLSVVWNFTLNRKFTFKSAANVPVAMLKVFGYYCVFAPLSIWWTVSLTNADVNKYLVLLGTMGVNLCTEYLFTRYVVYRHQLYTSEEGQRDLENRQSDK
jgi:putative flippase GtrA